LLLFIVTCVFSKKRAVAYELDVPSATTSLFLNGVRGITDKGCQGKSNMVIFSYGKPLGKI
jgi:hypothetical protein